MEGDGEGTRTMEADENGNMMKGMRKEEIKIEKMESVRGEEEKEEGTQDKANRGEKKMTKN